MSPGAGWFVAPLHVLARAHRTARITHQKYHPDVAIVVAVHQQIGQVLHRQAHRFDDLNGKLGTELAEELRIVAQRQLHRFAHLPQVDVAAEHLLPRFAELDVVGKLVVLASQQVSGHLLHVRVQCRIVQIGETEFHERLVVVVGGRYAVQHFGQESGTAPPRRGYYYVLGSRSVQLDFLLLLLQQLQMHAQRLVGRSHRFGSVPVVDFPF